jgi:hypothetical protein
MAEVPEPENSPFVSYAPEESPMLEFDDLPRPSTPEMLEIAARASPPRGEGSRQPNALNLQLSPDTRVNNISVEGWGEPSERAAFPPEWQQPWAHSPEPTEAEMPSPARDVGIQLEPEDLYVDRDFAAEHRKPEVRREHILRHDFPNGVLKYTIQTDPEDRETRDSGTPIELEKEVHGLEDAIAAYWTGPLRIRNRTLLENHLMRTGINAKYNKYLWRELGRFEHARILHLQRAGRLGEWHFRM